MRKRKCQVRKAIQGLAVTSKQRLKMTTREVPPTAIGGCRSDEKLKDDDMGGELPPFVNAIAEFTQIWLIIDYAD